MGHYSSSYEHDAAKKVDTSKKADARRFRFIAYAIGAGDTRWNAANLEWQVQSSNGEWHSDQDLRVAADKAQEAA